MSRIKLIALDLDNTTLNEESTLSAQNREAIEAKIAEGTEVVIATGRGLSGIPKEMWDISKITYAITSNGACIYNIRTGEIIRQFAIPSDTEGKLLEIAAKYPCALELFVSGNAYVCRKYWENPMDFGIPSHLVDYIHRTRKIKEDFEGFISGNMGLVENFVFVLKDQKTHDIVFDECKAAGECFVTGSDPWWVEVMSPKAGKGKALKAISEYLNISLSDTAAFGDADNDLEMLEFAGVSVAVSNASASLKNIAEYITKDHDEDGVAYALTHFDVFK